MAAADRLPLHCLLLKNVSFAVLQNAAPGGMGDAPFTGNRHEGVFLSKLRLQFIAFFVAIIQIDAVFLGSALEIARVVPPGILDCPVE